MINERVLKNKIDQIYFLNNWWQQAIENLSPDCEAFRLGLECSIEVNKALAILEWVYRNGITVLPNELNLSEFEQYIIGCEARKNEHNQISTDA